LASPWASDLADADAEQLGGFGLSALAAQGGVQDFEDVWFTLAHLDPVRVPHSSRHVSSLAFSWRTFLLCLVLLR
jgi:hypothetical protein